MRPKGKRGELGDRLTVFPGRSGRAELESFRSLVYGSGYEGAINSLKRGASDRKKRGAFLSLRGGVGYPKENR
jgi:hypothetical protein